MCNDLEKVGSPHWTISATGWFEKRRKSRGFATISPRIGAASHHSPQPTLSQPTLSAAVAPDRMTRSVRESWDSRSYLVHGRSSFLNDFSIQARP
jgi:hypothetical protein